MAIQIRVCAPDDHAATAWNLEQALICCVDEQWLEQLRFAISTSMQITNRIERKLYE